jgi:hypothetical protein
VRTGFAGGVASGLAQVGQRGGLVAGDVAVGLGAGAEVAGAVRLVGGEVDGAAGAGRVGLLGEVLPVVEQGVEHDGALREFGRDGVAVRGELGDEALVLGELGAFLADPLGGVLPVAAVAEVVHDPVDGLGVAVELGQQRELLQRDRLAEPGGDFPGESGHLPGF